MKERASETKAKSEVNKAKPKGDSDDGEEAYANENGNCDLRVWRPDFSRATGLLRAALLEDSLLVVWYWS
jgi:hypothetical protein